MGNQRPSPGTGLARKFLVVFTDDQDSHVAWTVAQDLAKQERGKRQGLIKAFFVWLAQYRAQNGYYPSADTLAGLLWAGLSTGVGVGYSYSSMADTDGLQSAGTAKKLDTRTLTERTDLATSNAFGDF